MKKLILLFMLALTGFLQAQRGSDHWLPPMYTSGAVGDHFVHVSTAETTPFDVVLVREAPDYWSQVALASRSLYADSRMVVAVIRNVTRGNPGEFMFPRVNNTYSGADFSNAPASTNQYAVLDDLVVTNNNACGTPIGQGLHAYAVMPGTATAGVLDEDNFTPGNFGTRYPAASDKQFYCNVRLLNSTGNPVDPSEPYIHAEFLTSKAESGKGREFRVATLPMFQTAGEGSPRSFSVSIMATEEGETTVTIHKNAYNGLISFVGIPGQPLSGINNLEYKLKKGQTLILAGQTDSNITNKRDFIGTRITATQDVVMLNGNFVGQMIEDINNSVNDIYADFSVPINQLGTQFAVVKGRGEVVSGLTGTAQTLPAYSASTTSQYALFNRDVERVMVVATESNTQIKVNGNVLTTIGNIDPLATTPARAYYLIPSKYYQTQAGANHHHMAITTDKPVYVYQFLVGASDNPSTSNNESTPTGGMNFIPPLTCFCDNNVTEISRVNQIGTTNSLGINNANLYNFTTDLTIVTRAHSTADTNYVDYQDATNPRFNIPTTEAYPLAGLNGWVTYSIKNAIGNVAMSAEKPMLGGIFGFNGAAGYGGFFSTFTPRPKIKIKSGTCYNELNPSNTIKLAFVKEDSSKFTNASVRWFYKASGATAFSPVPLGLPADPKSGDFADGFEPTQPGTYYAVISNGTCSEPQSNEIIVTRCNPPVREETINMCQGEVLKNFKFDWLSREVAMGTDTRLPVSMNIERNGDIVGTLIRDTLPDYTYKNTVSNTEKVTFSIELKNGTYSEKINYTVIINALPTGTVKTIEACDTDKNGNVEINLNDAGLNKPGYSVNYYTKLLGGQVDTNSKVPDALIDNHKTKLKEVYAVITDLKTRCTSLVLVVPIKHYPYVGPVGDKTIAVCPDKVTGATGAEVKTYTPDLEVIKNEIIRDLGGTTTYANNLDFVIEFYKNAAYTSLVSNTNTYTFDGSNPYLYVLLTSKHDTNLRGCGARGLGSYKFDYNPPVLSIYNNLIPVCDDYINYFDGTVQVKFRGNYDAGVTGTIDEYITKDPNIDLTYYAVDPIANPGATSISVGNAILIKATNPNLWVRMIDTTNPPRYCPSVVKIGFDIKIPTKFATPTQEVCENGAAEFDLSLYTNVKVLDAIDTTAWHFDTSSKKLYIYQANASRVRAILTNADGCSYEETFKVTVPVKVNIKVEGLLPACDNANGEATFDVNNIKPINQTTKLVDPKVSDIKYYETLADITANKSITLTAGTFTTKLNSLYVQYRYDYGNSNFCLSEPVKINLVHVAPPSLEAPQTIEVCSVDYQGKVEQLYSYIQDVLALTASTTVDYNVKYYANNADRIGKINPIDTTANPYWIAYFDPKKAGTQVQTVFVNIESKDPKSPCDALPVNVDFKLRPFAALNSNVQNGKYSMVVCDTDATYDNKVTYNLALSEPSITNGKNKVTFYKTQADLIGNTDAISPKVINLTDTPISVFAKVEPTLGEVACSQMVELVLSTKQPIITGELLKLTSSIMEVCDGTTIDLSLKNEVTAGIYSNVVWNINGSKKFGDYSFAPAYIKFSPNITTYQVTFDHDGCTYTLPFKIKVNPLPVLSPMTNAACILKGGSQTAEFDLDATKGVILAYTYEYYKQKADGSKIVGTTKVLLSKGEKLYAKATAPGGCTSDYTEVVLTFNDRPFPLTAQMLAPLEVCDDDANPFDGSTKVDIAKARVFTAQPNYDYKFYTNATRGSGSEIKLNAGKLLVDVTGPTKIYGSMVSKQNPQCEDEDFEFDIKFKPRVYDGLPAQTQKICIAPNDPQRIESLSNYRAFFDPYLPAGTQVNFYDNSTGLLATSVSFNSASTGTKVYRVEFTPPATSTNVCKGQSTLTFEITQMKASPLEQQKVYYVCDGGSITLDADASGSGFSSVAWKRSGSIFSTKNIETFLPGAYTLVMKTGNCEREFKFDVEEFSISTPSANNIDKSCVEPDGKIIFNLADNVTVNVNQGNTLKLATELMFFKTKAAADAHVASGATYIGSIAYPINVSNPNYAALSKYVTQYSDAKNNAQEAFVVIKNAFTLPGGGQQICYSTPDKMDLLNYPSVFQFKPQLEAQIFCPNVANPAATDINMAPITKYVTDYVTGKVDAGSVVYVEWYTNDTRSTLLKPLAPYKVDANTVGLKAYGKVYIDTKSSIKCPGREIEIELKKGEQIDVKDQTDYVCQTTINKDEQYDLLHFSTNATYNYYYFPANYRDAQCTVNNAFKPDNNGKILVPLNPGRNDYRVLISDRNGAKCDALSKVNIMYSWKYEIDKNLPPVEACEGNDVKVDLNLRYTDVTRPLPANAVFTWKYRNVTSANLPINSAVITIPKVDKDIFDPTNNTVYVTIKTPIDPNNPSLLCPGPEVPMPLLIETSPKLNNIKFYGCQINDTTVKVDLKLLLADLSTEVLPLGTSVKAEYFYQDDTRFTGTLAPFDLKNPLKIKVVLTKVVKVGGIDVKSCSTTGTFDLLYHPLPKVKDQNYYEFCDDDLDDTYKISTVDLDNIIRTLVVNPDDQKVAKFYYTSDGANTENSSELVNGGEIELRKNQPNPDKNILFKDVFLRIPPVGNCAPFVKPIQLRFKKDLPHLEQVLIPAPKICLNPTNTVKDPVDLRKYLPILFKTTDPLYKDAYKSIASGTAVDFDKAFKFYRSQVDMIANVNALTFKELTAYINDVLEKDISQASGRESFVSKFIIKAFSNSPDYCDTYARLKLEYQTTRLSTTLKDKKICIEGDKVTLDAGPGFTQHRWFDPNGNEITPSGSDPSFSQKVVVSSPGTYKVWLYTNDCFYEQPVTVSYFSRPVITNVEIEGNKVVISAIKGSEPYEYSMDGDIYQPYNTYVGLTKGEHSIKVRSTEPSNTENGGCESEPVIFTILDLVNIVTPNGDGFNDVYDFSELKGKQDPVLSLYDRYGRKLFTLDNTTQFTWNGLFDDRVLPTASYWYTVEYTEPKSGIKTSYSGWLIVKNR